MRIDLHIHTTASDGRWTPAQVIAGVKEASIGLFAITDHDTVGNVIATEKLAWQHKIAFIRAVEISTTLAGRMYHILGYGINPNAPTLLATLAENTQKLLATDDEDIHQLIALGYAIDYADYETYTYDRTRGGFKSYNYLLDRGFCTGTHDFFVNLRSQLGHKWPEFIHPREAVQLIRDAGGVPVLAHPEASLEGGVTELGLDTFADYGIAGVECHSQYHDEAITSRCVTWCRHHGLAITGGSDYHGGFVGRELGIPYVTTEMLELREIENRIINGFEKQRAVFEANHNTASS